MSYIQDTLLEDEELVYQARLHWILFLRSIFVLIFSLIIIKAVDPSTYRFFGSLLSLFLAIVLIDDLIKYYSTEFAITDKRILSKAGFIRRKSTEIYISKIESTYLNQSILGRMLDYGTIIVSGSGGSKTHYKNMDSPLLFRNNIQSLLSSNI